MSFDETAYRQEYYQKNKEKIISRSKEWAINNKEKRREICKKSYEKAKENGITHQEKYRKFTRDKYLYNIAKRRAKSRGMEFSIDLEDLGEIPECCPLLGIPLCGWDEDSDSSLSIDRIDSSKGYIKGNVQWISQRANRLKNNTAPEELLNLAINLFKIVYGEDL